MYIAVFKTVAKKQPQSINVPYVNINIPFLNKQDRLDIAFGVNQSIDYIAASFVRTKEDIVGLEYLRSFMQKMKNYF